MSDRDEAQVWRALALRAVSDLGWCVGYLRGLNQPVPDSVRRTIDAVTAEADRHSTGGRCGS